MSKLNWTRLILAGVVAGAIIFLVEGVASGLYMEEMEAAMEAHNLSVEMSAGVMVLYAAMSLLFGIAGVWLYAVLRPRYPSRPLAAFIAALFLWVMGYVASYVGLGSMGLFPAGMLLLWAAIGLVELVVALQVGVLLYKEP